jgi:O-antigen ligase
MTSPSPQPRAQCASGGRYATAWFARRGAARSAQLFAVACVLILPLALLYARALAEILIAATDILFLVHLRTTRAPIAWHSPLLWIAASWWAWQVICSALGTGGFVLALVAFRLPLFAVALGDWVLAAPRRRRLLWWVIAAAVAWIMIESWQQYLLGTNIFGIPRFGDGALTGPFNRPRAGPALILTLFPVLVPAVAALLASRRPGVKVAAGLLAAGGAATVLLIGQRMPSALLLLGLVLTGAMLPRLRIAVGAAIILGAALVATTPLTAPATYQKLVLRTRDQLTHFVYSPYGEIWVRAAVIAEEHPWRGLGFDGFRRGCGDPRAVRGLPELGVTLAEAMIATDACNIHPHNYYLEAADNGGIPLMALFAALVIATWRKLARGLRQGLDPLRAGLLVGFTLAFWPLASTSALTGMPNAGWIMLLTGFGCAEARRDDQAASNSSI